ncbi:MFS transporter, partial [Herbaspirillum lusitanum]|uniref:MFS transporter n=1 Tax=Herbaspirillum lusitanum TaxID=213312 RepID=UPI00035C8DFA
MDSGDRDVKTIEQAMEERPLGWYQWRILFICFICLMVDGFDAQALAYVAPVMRQELGISTSELGLIFSSSLIGMLFGAFLLSPLADRFGRRPMMIAAMGICSVAMLLAPATASFSSLVAIRFVTGLGLGVILPNALALVSEFSPERRRSILVMLTSLGLPAGAAPGGLIAAALIPAHGWRSVFIFGGVTSLLVTAIVFCFLPESLRFLVEAGKAQSISANRSLRNLFGREASNVELHKKEKTQNWSSITALFSDGRRAGTFLFWTVTFCNLLCLYFLANWLPVLLRDQGLDLGSALLAASAMQAGGLPGVVSISYFSRKFGSTSTLCVTYL